MNLQELLEKSVVVDAHSDFLSDVLFLRRSGAIQVIENKYLPALRAGNVKVVVAAIFIESLFVPAQAMEMAFEQIDCLHQEMAESPGKFCLCTTYEQIQEAMAHDQLAILLSMEGVEPIGQNLSLLRTFHRLGVRLMGPAWGRRNAACEGSTLVDEPNSWAGGLSNFGKELILEAERLGILIDLSHINDMGYRNICQVTNSTLFASHSNCRDLNPMERNVSDEIIRTIAARGGVIGINSVNTICAEKEEDATLEMLVRHMEHIRDIAGIDVIGLGLDMVDGMNFYEPLLPSKKMKRKIQDIVKGYKDIPALVQCMLDRGWNNSEIQAVLGGNFLRMYQMSLCERK